MALRTGERDRERGTFVLSVFFEVSSGSPRGKVQKGNLPPRRRSRVRELRSLGRSAAHLLHVTTRR